MSEPASSAPRNPWGARGLEWQVASPPPEHNFDEPVVVLADDYEPYDYWRPERTS